MRGSFERLTVLRANLRSSGKRLWAAAAAVAISVAFIVAGSMLVDSMTRAVTAEAEQEAAGADLVVFTSPLFDVEEGAERADGSHYGDTVLADGIEALPGVAQAEAIRSAFLYRQVEGDDFFTGVEVRTMSALQDYELTSGNLPQAADEVLLNSTSAASLDLQPGDTFVHSDGSDAEGAEYTVAGVSAEGGQPSGWLTAEGLEAMSDVWPEQIRVLLPEADHGRQEAQSAVQQDIGMVIQDLVEAGELPMLAEEGSSGTWHEGQFGSSFEGDTYSLDVFTHGQVVELWIAERTGDAQTMQWIAFGFGGIAVFVSALVIANTFQVIVASRLRTMALVRAVGGTAAQLRRATLFEGVLLGLLGGAAGVMIGWGIAQGAVLIVNHVNDGIREIPPVLPTPLAVGIGLGLGLLMAAGSALLPALKAGRVSPMAALRPAEVEEPERGASRIRIGLGAAFTAVGLGAVVYAATTNPSTVYSEDAYQVFNTDPITRLPLPALGVLGALVGFTGVLILAKVVIPRIAALLGNMLSRLGVARVATKLAGENARRVPGRTTATSAALLVGITLVMTMTVGAATAEKLLQTELSETQPLDGLATTLDEGLAEDLRQRDVIETVRETPTIHVQTDSGTDWSALIMESAVFDEVAHLPLADLTDGGTVGFVGTDFWSEMPSSAETGVVTLSPVGSDVAHEFTVELAFWAPSDAVLLPETAVPEGWEISDELGMMARVTEEATAEEIWALQSEISGEHGTGLGLEGAASRAEMSGFIDTVLLAVIALLGASVFVAVLGVSNTLSLSVFERRREGALLRASGMTRGALGATISIEALLLAAVALILGTGLGILFGWAGVSTLAADEDWSVTAQIPWLRVAAVWGVTFLAALAAAWWPARRLSRVQPAAGLSHAA